MFNELECTKVTTLTSVHRECNSDEQESVRSLLLFRHEICQALICSMWSVLTGHVLDLRPCPDDHIDRFTTCLAGITARTDKAEME